MTQKDLVREISKTVEMPAAEVKKVLDVFKETVKEALAKGEKVKIQGFGTFSVEKRASRETILKGVKYTIPERLVPVVSFSTEVKNKVNNNQSFEG